MNTLQKTLVKSFQENGNTYTITAKLKLEHITGNRSPYFSITGEIKRVMRNNNHFLESCGSMHSEIEKHFPELKEFTNWHLTDLFKPMHYLENSLYWFGFTESTYKDARYYEIRKDAAKNTCLYGVLNSDFQNFTLNDLYFDLIDSTSKDSDEYEVLKGYASTFLNNRLTSLMQKFDIAMIRVFGFTDYYRLASQFGENLEVRINTFRNSHTIKQLEF
jgi:hypothetical protein